jgi:alkaline phosphatase
MKLSAKILALAGMTSALAACATAAPSNDAALSPYATPAVPQANDPYFRAGAESVANAPAGARARNVILFVGDGMGVATVTAARIYAGQSQGLDGESYNLTHDTFPRVALSRT